MNYWNCSVVADWSGRIYWISKWASKKRKWPRHSLRHQNKIGFEFGRFSLPIVATAAAVYCTVKVSQAAGRWGFSQWQVSKNLCISFGAEGILYKKCDLWTCSKSDSYIFGDMRCQEKGWQRRNMTGRDTGWIQRSSLLEIYLWPNKSPQNDTYISMRIPICLYVK